MTARTPHLRSLLLASVLALVAVGCGVETSSDGASSPVPSVDDPSVSPESGSSGTDDSTTAPADEGEDDTTTTTTDDTPAEGPDDVTIPDMPEGFDEDTFKDSLAMGFESAGLTEEQAACVADGYVEEFGTDAGSATDYTAMLDLFANCDVDLMDLGG